MSDEPEIIVTDSDDPATRFVNDFRTGGGTGLAVPLGPNPTAESETLNVIMVEFTADDLPGDLTDGEVVRFLMSPVMAASLAASIAYAVREQWNRS